MMTLAILSALPEEQAGLAQMLTAPHTVLAAGRQFVQGTLQGRSLVLALSGVGKVAAATTTAVLIERFAVKQVLFTGVAGGLGAGVNVGDVVVGASTLQHDMDASPLFPRFEIPFYGRAHFAADAVMLENMLQAANSISIPLKVHTGLIVSGDQFISSPLVAANLRADIPDALCVEMEGAAVAQVCADYGVPYVTVRTISDRADDTAHIDFAQFVKQVAGPVAVELVMRYVLLSQKKLSDISHHLTF